MFELDGEDCFVLVLRPLVTVASLLVDERPMVPVLGELFMMPPGPKGLVEDLYLIPLLPADVEGCI